MMNDPHFNHETTAAFLFIFGIPWLASIAIFAISLLIEGGA
tara:strand:+ start:7710 stop:7832 length:123 start_codon:yes stop_codon:yes gene_type:complete